MMSFQDTVLLSRQEVAGLLSLDECMRAVELAFRMFAEGKANPSKVLGVQAAQGGFHIKAGTLRLGQNYFVAKTNANFPGNPNKHGLPTIQGVILVFDADNGTVLAVIDTIEITILRTGAATGVAAKYLAREDAKVATICGCGNQGRVSLKALLKVRDLELVYAYDADPSRSEKYAEELSGELNISIVPVDDLRTATLQSDICVTCTPSEKPLLFREDVRPGTFIAAVGADHPHKQEIDPALIASSKLIVDLAEQSAGMGDLHHALTSGDVTLSHIHAELGEVIAGKKQGRKKEEEVIVFDSTGTALQDVASAAIVFEKAMENGLGLRFDFGK